jgi:ribosomal protein L11 methyltransferase
MKWNEITITTSREASDAVCDMLTTLGAQGVTIEDPEDILSEFNNKDGLDYVDPEFLKNLGTDVLVKAYFHNSKIISELLLVIKEKLSFISGFLDIGKGGFSTNTIDEEDWANSWKKYYNTFDISPNVTIKPSWQNVEVKEGKIVIELDPGMAFGTGTHETTKMCGVLLEKYIKKGNCVFDVGTGSGILAIMASKLGASNVRAIDIDELAVKVAKENAEINHENANIIIQKSTIEEYKGQGFDIIIANIIANVIVAISTQIKKNLKQNGLFITSGIIKDRMQDVIDTYTRLGFEIVETEEMGEWVAMVLRCPNTL